MSRLKYVPSKKCPVEKVSRRKSVRRKNVPVPQACCCHSTKLVSITISIVQSNEKASLIAQTMQLTRSNSASVSVNRRPNYVLDILKAPVNLKTKHLIMNRVFQISFTWFYIQAHFHWEDLGTMSLFSRTWRLVYAQLSNKSCYCTVTIILTFHKTQQLTTWCAMTILILLMSYMISL